MKLKIANKLLITMSVAWLALHSVSGCSRDFNNDVFDEQKDSGTSREGEVPTEGLVAFYPFNGNANDESGNDNHGNVVGPLLIPDRFGHENRAYSFDGRDDLISINHRAIPPPFTVSAWIRKKGSKSAQRFLVDADFDLKIEQWQNSHKIGYTRRRRVDYAFNYVLPLNTWKLVTWVFDNEAKLYVDGIHVATNSSLTSCPLGTIGTSEPNALLCDVDDVLVYSRALTEDEIQSLYRVGGWAN